MNINDVITIVLESVLVPALIYGVYLLRNYLNAKIKSAQLRDILDQATDAAVKAVSETSQVYVDNIKGTAEWNEEAQRHAFEMSKARLLDLLSVESWQLLETVTGNAQAYLEAAIEEAVRDSKLVC